MDKVIRYLERLDGDKSGSSGDELANAHAISSLQTLENLLKQVEEDAVAGNSTNVSSITPADGSASRRPSFAALERFLDSINGGHEGTTPADTSSLAPPSAKLTNPIESSQTDGQVAKQIFFDCDNTLVDTEAVAVEACGIVVNKCLADHNISYRYTTEELVLEFFGYTARKMIIMLADVYEFVITPEEVSAYARYEEDLVIDLIHANPKPCDGIERLLEHLSESKRYNLSVVSSSPIRRIRAALEAAGIAEYFDEDQVFSAKSSMPTPKPKPDPAIYKFAMEYNKVHPWQCVAFEDSRSGARSAIFAEIPCIAYLGTYSNPTQQDQVGATLMDEGCKEIMTSWSQALGCLERVEQAAAIEVATSLDKWDDWDEKKRQLRLRLGQLLLEEKYRTRKPRE